ncbi:hypothetical protein [Hymenobacter sp. YC55]|uniref:hypothetical protein n=1 Tax=Hymenobacter sp. YC55 TaxID=3034019 RepID=UPI0023F61BDD|nr:hypothetical protein [Hymenobacter sp. YC55]MDF7815430.1 hypothetical protein [Hymenobacter sp. YC55]
MKKLLFLALAAASFSFASCDSPKENAQEDAADRVEAAGEAKEDQLEAAGASDAAGDQAEEAGEMKADSMRADADAKDPQ